MQTWIIPFIYAAIILGIYLLSPETQRPALQRRIRRDINFYMITDIVLVAFSIISTLAYTQHWLKWITWGAFVVTMYISIRKAVTKDARETRAEQRDEA